MNMSSKKKTPSQKSEAPPKGNLKRLRLGIRVLDDDATPATPEVTTDAPTTEVQDESKATMPWDPPTTEATTEPDADVSRLLTGTGVLAKIGQEWFEHLKTTGTSASTLASYQSDFANAVTHFGSMDNPHLWSETDIATYENATSVTHTKSGKTKAMPTILKTRRVLRMALTWAFETRRLNDIPYATKGRIPVEQIQD